jgi:membrane protease YdiL (CAAX protease family)
MLDLGASAPAVRAREMAAVPSALLYTVLVALFSTPFYVILSRTGLHGNFLVFVLMWCPAAAGFVSALLARRRITAFGWRWPGVGFMGGAYAIPVLYAAVAYGAVWALGFGRPSLQHFFMVTHRPFMPIIVLVVTVGVLGSCLAALGEEIGWRGFLVPVLASRFGLTGAALMSGVIWTCWHVPLIVFADYHGGGPAWFSVTCFAVLVMAVAFLFAWMRMVSGSVWPCVMLHAVHNTVVQAVFTPLTADTGHTGWFIDEFGVALPLTAIAATLLVVRVFPVHTARLG